MSFKPIADLDCETTIQIGGKDKKTNKPNPKSLEGYYIGSKPITTKFGPGKIHIFQTENGNVGVWGKTDMDNKLATVNPGRMVRLAFTGTVPSKKGNPMWKYKVEVDEDNQIEVAEAEQQLTGDQEPDGADYSDPSDHSDPVDDTDPGADEPPADEPPPVRAQAPRKPAQAPSAARQAAVQNLLKQAKRPTA